MAMLAAMPVLAQEHHDWEDASIVSRGKLPYHATLQLPSKEAECKEIVSLDGQWYTKIDENNFEVSNLG